MNKNSIFKFLLTAMLALTVNTAQAGIYFGHLKPKKIFDVPSFTTGMLKSISVRPGMSVKKDQVLGTIVSLDIAYQEYKLISPCDCTVAQLVYEEGAFIERSNTVLKLVSPKEFTSEVYVNPADKRHLSKLKQAQILLENGGSVPVDISISYISQLQEKDIYGFKVELDVSCIQKTCEDLESYIGYFVKVQIPDAKT